ncbi:DUF6415 family natural product biosynthesis protein [Streptomyces sp. NRRL B-1347]|uniref:DUF6415 family natural product biosynthesis protein n=1 Tax=Streptomyces sp. NRRL B-1347 TaxID=1476877 RepID=UPI00131AAD7C|nr:DUF6415 family natural product biosynthesis protein [Streptomyces sp. NRRL B-1347]
MTDPSHQCGPALALRSEQGHGREDSPSSSASPGCRDARLVLRLDSAHQLAMDGVPHLAAVSGLRHAFTDALRTWGVAQMVDDVGLVVTELVTNALIHGTACDGAVLSHGHGLLLVEVADTSAVAPVQVRVPSGSGGRGLALVGTLSQDWGWTLHRHGKRVWALLAVHGTEHAGSHMDTARRPAHQTVADALPADRGLAATIDCVLDVWNPRRPGSLPRVADAQRVAALLGSHLQLLIMDTRRRANRLPRVSSARDVAEQTVNEARRRMSWSPGTDLLATVGHAQRLARSVRALLLVRHTVDEAMGWQ